MKRKFSLTASLVVVGLVFLSSCSMSQEKRGSEHDGDEKEHREKREKHTDGDHDKGSVESSREAHDRDEHGEGDGEEDGTQYSLDDQYDEIRHGARLVLQYDKKSNSFVGNVKNRTNEELKRVRVEVHLSNGKELGPTTPVALAPGASQDLRLKATEAKFESWSTHAEIGNREHGEGEKGHEGEEGHGEHSHGEGEGEHNNKEHKGEHDGERREHKGGEHNEHK